MEQMVERQPPFILNEHGDVEVFDSEAELLSYVESIDILNEEYEVWDGDGRKLGLRADPKMLTDGPLQKSELEALLRQHVRYLYSNGYVSFEPSNKASIQDLIGIIHRFQHAGVEDGKNYLTQAKLIFRRIFRKN
ncbi:hypothetical protein [Protofrankia symbiont of Coriaria ruscifolia]|uniref:hypothetical protein n=1 Tax=Protofrankia symbiont of Coriaria ruscifolia TaxID=1306542 RepID=UPI0013EF7B49|nr:hypothetical protein [Protofrankia symbiont of Coriaria ruscifolia]